MITVIKKWKSALQEFLLLKVPDLPKGCRRLSGSPQSSKNHLRVWYNHPAFKHGSFKEAYRFLFYFAELYLRRLWFCPRGCDGKHSDLFRNVGLVLQFLGLLLTGSLRCQPSLGIALSQESSFAKNMPPSQGDPGPFFHSGQLWKVFSVSELLVAWGLIKTTSKSDFSPCPTLLLPLPSIGDSPRNTSIWTFCTLTSFLESTSSGTQHAVGLCNYIQWARQMDFYTCPSASSSRLKFAFEWASMIYFSIEKKKF